MPDFKIYTDGAATMRKVNGEYVREAGGWGYAILDENDEEVMTAYGGENMTTNNAMELTAIRNGLRKFLSFGYTGKTVEVYSDSAYCINIFTSWINSWKANGWSRGKKHEPIENVEIIKDIDTFLENFMRRFCSVEFVKVRGHAGDKWNEVCDKLAVKGKMEDACHGIEVALFPLPKTGEQRIAADLMPAEW